MKILSFDLELNQSPNGAKIIEVGACVGDVSTGEVIEQYFAFVNPHEPLIDFIITLTSITQEQVDAAGTLESAYLGMEAMAKKHDCCTMPIVWGGGDGHALRKELSPDVKWSFGRRELDVKAVFQAYQMAKEQKIQAGLAKAMTRLGLAFKGRKHRAVDDAINTFYIYVALLKNFQSQPKE
jgi:inhibitor of KinA sporulation pathway (predicted exonuclease)